MDKLLKQFLESIGVAPDEAIAELKEYTAAYPDLAERAQAIEDFIRSKASPEAIAAIPATLKGIALDVADGQTGRDPDAWAASG